MHAWHSIWYTQPALSLFSIPPSNQSLPCLVFYFFSFRHSGKRFYKNIIFFSNYFAKKKKNFSLSPPTLFTLSLTILSDGTYELQYSQGGVVTSRAYDVVVVAAPLELAKILLHPSIMCDLIVAYNDVWDLWWWCYVCDLLWWCYVWLLWYCDIIDYVIWLLLWCYVWNDVCDCADYECDMMLLFWYYDFFWFYCSSVCDFILFFF